MFTVYLLMRLWSVNPLSIARQRIFLFSCATNQEESKDFVEVNCLIGDCYFLNRDFANAVDFYSAALNLGLASPRGGELFLRLISAQVRAGLIEQASQLIDEADSLVALVRQTAGALSGMSPRRCKLRAS